MSTKQNKYGNDEDRIRAYKERQNNYSKKDWKCDVCNCVIHLGNKMNHLQSEKHFRNIAGDCIKSQLRTQWRCAVCDITICVRSMSNHLKSQRHRRNECPTSSESES